MDLQKIGKFIAEKRKQMGLTQLELAEKLSLTDRAVSKWETGRSLPDSSIMLDLCKELKISVNDLLNGEEIIMDNYKEKSEQLILELTKQKEESDRRLLTLEIVIGVFSVIILLVIDILASLASIKGWLKLILIIVGAIICFIGCLFALKIEQVAGYYECKECKHRYVPTFKAVNLAPHMGRTRYMKCPHCHKKSWQKKVIKKED